MNPRALFASRLGVVLGIGSIGVACGGKVIFDTAGGTAGTGTASGTGGATGGPTGGTTTSGVSSAYTTGAVTGASTGAGCIAVPMKAGQMVQHVCFNIDKSSDCPNIADPSLPGELASVINVGATCADNKQVVSVACADPQPAACCYTVITAPDCQLGRPFRAGDAVTRAELVERDDWCGPMNPTEGVLDAASMEHLATLWARDALAEHASVAAFARVVLELLAVGGPAALVRDTQAALGDEIRHAERSFGLASRYAGVALGPTALDVPGFSAPSLAEFAAATARDGCVSETVSALVAIEAKAHATDPLALAVLEEVAADEARHAELAWRTVDWALGAGGAEVAEAVERAFEDAIEGVRRSPWSDVAAPTGSLRTTARAHGQLDAAAKAAIERDALAEIIAPAAHALLAKHRSRGTRAVDLAHA